MSTEVSRLMHKAAADLFKDEEERNEFITAMRKGDCREQALIVMEDRNEIKAFPRMRHLKWQPSFVERIDDSFRPAKHPLYAKGAYYTLDFSSIFSASAMLAMDQPPERILDVCSSPGGKAIFAYRAFKPTLLYCNETIRKRAYTLIANLERCKCETSVVWSADTSVLAKKFPDTFDLIICDAPCSGQSLLAKGDEAPGCFSPQMIDMNVGRQRRITGNAYHCLRPGGYILYATCTFSPKENEKVIEWLLKQYDDLEVVEVPHLSEFQSRFSNMPMYRLYPHQGLGAGAFVALVRRKGTRPEHPPALEDLPKMWKYGEELKSRTPRAEEIEAEAKEGTESTPKVRTGPISTRAIVKEHGAPYWRQNPKVKKPRKRRK